MKDPLSQRSIVYLEAVSKIYTTSQGEFYGVREVTLDIQPGEFYSLLGSSGSGKTTTLRLIGGFETPEYGEVYIGGEAVTEQPAYRRDVHTVFQDYALFPHLTVVQNVAYPLTVKGTARAEWEPRVQEALRLVQIPTLGDRKPAQLSGGQQQRVALARALVNRPKVLLLDEPLSALDAQVREAVRQELRTLQRQTGITFIYVTHDQEEALTLSDRIAVMHQGQVEQVGTPEEIYRTPASAFVARFIGQANFLSGAVVAIAGTGETQTATVTVNDQPILATAPRYVPALGETVTLMLRPECIQVGTAIADNTVVGTLTETTYMGQRIECQVETPLGMLKVIQGGQRPAIGETLSLGWAQGDCLILPP